MLTFQSFLVVCTAFKTLADLRPRFCLRASPGRNVTAWQSWHLSNVSCSPDYSCYSTSTLESLSIFKLLKHEVRDNKPSFICSVFVALSCIKHSPLLLVVHIFSCGNVLFFCLSSFLYQLLQSRYRKKCEGF